MNVNHGASRGGALAFRVLLGIAAALALVLIAGTLYALAVRPGGAAPSAQTGQASGGRFSDNGVFTGIGRLRASTAGPDPATVILSVTFPYRPEDKPFAEELASHIADFRNAARGYFSSLSIAELREKDESAVKADILHRYNLLLRLGRIETVYFNEYLVIE